MHAAPHASLTGKPQAIVAISDISWQAAALSDIGPQMNKPANPKDWGGTRVLMRLESVLQSAPLSSESSVSRWSSA